VRSTIPLGRVSGIPVGMHWSALMVAREVAVPTGLVATLSWLATMNVLLGVSTCCREHRWTAGGYCTGCCGGTPATGIAPPRQQRPPVRFLARCSLARGLAGASWAPGRVVAAACRLVSRRVGQRGARSRCRRGAAGWAAGRGRHVCSTCGHVRVVDCAGTYRPPARRVRPALPAVPSRRHRRAARGCGRSSTSPAARQPTAAMFRYGSWPTRYPVNSLTPDLALEQVLRSTPIVGSGALAVVVADDQVIGVLTGTDIARAVEIGTLQDERSQL
jgi:hypothetical protein